MDPREVFLRAQNKHTMVGSERFCVLTWWMKSEKRRRRTKRVLFRKKIFFFHFDWLPWTRGDSCSFYPSPFTINPDDSAEFNIICLDSAMLLCPLTLFTWQVVNASKNWKNDVYLYTYLLFFFIQFS